MALISCSECGAQVSDLAPTCPHCGAPVAEATTATSSKTRNQHKRRVGLVVGLCVSAVVVLVIAGYATWAARAANSQNDAWATQSQTIGEESSSTSTVTVADDRTALTFTSQGGSTCTPAEIQAISAKIIHQMVLDGLGDLPASITQPIADKQAATTCATQKEASFATAISRTQTNVVTFLSAIGAPDSVGSTTNGMRGLDGTQTLEFFAADVGDVTMQARYDGTNGLSVTFIREHETFDWRAPFGH